MEIFTTLEKEFPNIKFSSSLSNANIPDHNFNSIEELRNYLKRYKDTIYLEMENIDVEEIPTFRKSDFHLSESANAMVGSAFPYSSVKAIGGEYTSLIVTALISYSTTMNSSGFVHQITSVSGLTSNVSTVEATVGIPAYQTHYYYNWTPSSSSANIQFMGARVELLWMGTLQTTERVTVFGVHAGTYTANTVISASATVDANTLPPPIMP